MIGGAVLAAALTTTSAHATSFHDETAASSDAKLVIDNRNSHEVLVYVVTEDGARYRLGTVAHLDARTFNLPTAVVDDGDAFRIKLYQLEQSTTYTHSRRTLKGVKTNTLTAEPGETIRLVVAADLEKSSVPGR
jgi:hypothetical protein